MLMHRTTEEIGTFVASEKSGKKHTLKIWGNFSVSQPFGGPARKFRTTTYVRTKDGLSVIRRGSGDYEVEDTGLMLHSDDPNAP
jgi:hypothetical protein